LERKKERTASRKKKAQKELRWISKNRTKTWPCLRYNKAINKIILSKKDKMERIKGKECLLQGGELLVERLVLHVPCKFALFYLQKARE